jgi:intergrase/recombinase
MRATILSFSILFTLFLYNLKIGFLKKYYAIINFRKSLKFKKYERALETAIYKEELSQSELMLTIRDRIKSYYPKGVSMFIPLSWKQKREIKAAIDLEFGDQMEKHNVKLTRNLKFV